MDLSSSTIGIGTGTGTGIGSHLHATRLLLPNNSDNNDVHGIGRRRARDLVMVGGGGGGGLSSNRSPRTIAAAGSPFVPSSASAADFSERTSPDEVRKEMNRCYQLIRKLGRGVVYLGSSRVGTQHPHYSQALELSREIAKLLDCTTWTGAGPGLMDAAFKGALEAKKPVGGFKIAKESGEWTSSNFHPYLSSEAYLTCRFFSARKHALVDAVVRNDPSEMTAVVAFPGGVGTLDEVFEILALIQLERMGSKLPVPFLLLNYDSYYSKLLDFIQECERWGTVSRGEVGSLWKVCSGNLEALEYLSEFYSLPQSRRDYDDSKKQGTVS